MFNRSTWTVLAVALLAAVAFYAGHWLLTRPPQPEPPLRAVAQRVPMSAPIAFSLRQSDDTALVPGELRGHWTVVVLGSLQAPARCQPPLALLARAQNEWMPIPDTLRPRVLYVATDADPPDPARAGEYAHRFHRDTLAASADRPALEALAQALDLRLERTGTNARGGCPVMPPQTLPVLDPQGRLAGLVHPPLSADRIAHDLQLLTESTAP